MLVTFFVLDIHLTSLGVCAFNINGARQILTLIFKHILGDGSRTILLKDELPILSA